MDNETLFYIFGGVAAVSAVLVTFVGLKLKNFPGRMLPLVVVWFAAFAVGASTFSVLQAKDHEAHEAHELEKAGEEIEHGSSGPFENEAGALGGESEELEEQAEKEAEGSQGEESIGPTEGSQKGDAGEKGGSPESESEGASSGAEASTTLQLAADPVEIAFDKTELSAKAGKVTIDFDNPAAIPHNVVIEKDGEELAGFEPITEAKESVSADLEAGSYQFVCTVPGHEEAGMVGTLTVE